MRAMDDPSQRPRSIVVYISSPGDVQAERDVVKRVAQDINEDPAWRARCRLTVLAYEDSSAPQMGRMAQRIVDDFMRKSSQADIVVSIFCNRMGTPTIDEESGQPFKSGAHYEFDSAYSHFVQSGEDRPRIMLYLGDKGISPDAADEAINQYLSVREFKQGLRRQTKYQGLIGEYRDLVDFEIRLRKDLKLHLAQLLTSRDAGAKDADTPGDSTDARLSAHAARLIESHRWLELSGIREAGTLRIDLERVYVALRADPRSEFDRKQAAALTQLEVQESSAAEESNEATEASPHGSFAAAIEAEVIRRTYRDRGAKAASGDVARTLGEAVRQHRRVVILGKPGTGKSTLGRWLVLQFARAFKEQIETGVTRHVIVPLAQVDPDSGAQANEALPIDLGPARLPVFLRIAHFARELARRDEAKLPSLSVADYLGTDPDSSSLGDSLGDDERNALIRAQLAAQNALVILDGLDELTDLNRRTVVHKIQDFVEAWTTASTDGSRPHEVGRNQIVITSRPVGYDSAPVQSDCAHFSIEPMQRPAVERFVHSWASAVNGSAALSMTGELDAAGLIAEIYSDERPALRELAENPLLVTILSTVYWSEGHLPEHRAGLYDCVVENLLRIWLQREECVTNRLVREELLAALEPLAADMQENARSNGLVGIRRLGEIVSEHLAHFRGTTPTDRRFFPVRDALLLTIRKHVGLLAEQSPGNYAFFHRQIQEFLAARHLLSRPGGAARAIIDRLDDPLWREPVVLALGLTTILPEWGPSARAALLTSVLQSDSEDALLPRAALMLVNAMPDLHNAESELVSEITKRLVRAYAISLNQGYASTLRLEIEKAIQRLRNAHGPLTVVATLTKLLRDSDASHAVAALTRHLGWTDAELLEAMITQVHLDTAEFDWPIYRALVAAIAAQSSETPNALVPRIEALLPMRRLLQQDPTLLGWLNADRAWISLLIALYGGVAIDNQADTETNSDGVALRTSFDPSYIVHDLADKDLSRVLRAHLSARKPAAELAPILQAKWRDGKKPTECAEALLALAALGEDVDPYLNEALADVHTQPRAHAARNRFRRLSRVIGTSLVNARDAIMRAVSTSPTSEAHFPLVLTALETLLEARSSDLALATSVPTFNFAAPTSEEQRRRLRAEDLCWRLQHAPIPYSDADELIEAWGLLPHSSGAGSKFFESWGLPVLAPRPRNARDSYLSMLDSLLRVPREYEAFAGATIGACRPFVLVNPQLLCETIAALRILGRDAIDAYCASIDPFVLDERTVESLNLTEHHKVLRALAPLRGHVAPSAGAFASKVSATIGFDLWSRHRTLLLKDARRSDFSDREAVEDFCRNAASHIGQIDDPYLRFRARLRSPDIEETAASLDELTRDLEMIADAHERLLAIELLLNKGFGRSLGVSVAIELALEIRDKEDRARALLRILASTGPSADLMENIAEALGEIEDEEARVITIGAARRALGALPGVEVMLGVSANSIASLSLRERAKARPSRTLARDKNASSEVQLQWRLRTSDAVFATPSPHARFAWSLLFMQLLSREYGTATIDPALLYDAWRGLSGQARQASLRKLVRQGMKEGLKIGSMEAVLLDLVLHDGDGDLLQPLWPLLEFPRPDSKVLAWQSRDDMAGAWSALVQVEDGKLTTDTALKVLPLLTHSDDRLRHRARLALHSRNCYTSNPYRRWRVGRVGAGPLEAIARAAIAPEASPAQRNALGWVHANIIHDSPDAMRDWIARAQDAKFVCDATWLIQGMQAANDEVVEVIVTTLDHAHPRSRVDLLRACAQLEHCTSALSRAERAPLAALTRVDPATRIAVGSHTARADGMLKIVNESILGRSCADALTLARNTLDEGRVYLTDDDVLSSKACVKKLGQIGGARYTFIDTYWINAANEAERIERRDLAMRVLLQWLEAEFNHPSPILRLQDLLTATDALARHSLDTFALEADPAIWEKRFCEWATHHDHWAARAAAIRLVGKLRRVSDHVVEALRSAMADVSFVQTAAFEAVSELRKVEGDLVGDLVTLLTDRVPSVAASTATLLSNLANTELTPGARKKALAALEAAASREAQQRPYYVIDETSQGMELRYVDCLDKVFYRSIFEINRL